MAKAAKEISKLKLEADNGVQYIRDNLLRGVGGSVLDPGSTRNVLFAFGSVWSVDTGSYANTAPLPGQTVPSVYRLLRIDPATKRVVAIIPLPGRLSFRPGYVPPGHELYNIGLSMCEGAGKVWLAFGRGGKGPWGNGDRSDQYQTGQEGQDYGMPWARGLVISVDPADNMVKTINPLDNATDFPSIVFGGGFIWVSQTPKHHDFADDVPWSPLLRIDPSSSYFPGDPNLMARHPTLRVMLDGLSEEAYPTQASAPYPPWREPYTNNYSNFVGYHVTALWRTAFGITDMIFADGYLIMVTRFRYQEWYSRPVVGYVYDIWNSYYRDVYRVSSMNVSNLQVKKGPDIPPSYGPNIFFQERYPGNPRVEVVIKRSSDITNIAFSPLNGGSIWYTVRLSRNRTADGRTYYQEYDEIWVGDMDLNFAKMPIQLDASYMEPLLGVPPGDPELLIVYSLAFDGIDMFATISMGLGIYGDYYNSFNYRLKDGAILRINPKNKTIKSIIKLEFPAERSSLVNPNIVPGTIRWIRSYAFFIVHAEDGIIWGTPGYYDFAASFGDPDDNSSTPTFPIKQGRFGGWKVGKI